MPEPLQAASKTKSPDALDTYKFVVVRVAIALLFVDVALLNGDVVLTPERATAPTLKLKEAPDSVTTIFAEPTGGATR